MLIYLLYFALVVMNDFEHFYASHFVFSIFLVFRFVFYTMCMNLWIIQNSDIIYVVNTMFVVLFTFISYIIVYMRLMILLCCVLVIQFNPVWLLCLFVLFYFKFFEFHIVHHELCSYVLPLLTDLSHIFHICKLRSCLLLSYHTLVLIYV